MIFLFVWMLFTGVAFHCSKRHNENCNYELLKVTWEPWVISAGIGLLMIMSLA